jgi:hypothetical protein
MIRRLALLLCFSGAHGCASKCERAADHVVTLAYDEMIAAAAKRPDAELVIPNLPSKPELAQGAGELARRRLAAYCADSPVLDCVIAAKSSTDARRCETQN